MAANSLYILVSANGYLVKIDYNVSDYSNDAKLAFFVDTDINVYDGTQIGEIIVSGSSGSFVWDSYGFVPGDYWIYAMLDDGQAPPLFSSSNFPINVGDEIYGSNGNDFLLGNDLESRIFGYAGDDVLNGGFGVADDYMEGGLGSDIYYVDTAGDVVVEKPGEGNDTVNSKINLVLYPNVENLTLAFGAGNLSGTGNELDNILTGNLGVNTLIGGRGNDTYVIGDGDVVIEQAGEGTDTVYSSISYILGETLENLVLTGIATQGTGNKLDNVLIGSDNTTNILIGGAGNDFLDGGPEGPYSMDFLYGGTGDDTYVVTSGRDVVGEQAGEGTDTVLSSITYSLDETLENLVLTGSNAINGNGNALNNVLIGNDGANILVGGTGKDVSTDTLSGGLGADTLYGGTGARDTFVFDSALGSGNVDWLADFKKDNIALDIDIFTSLNLGDLPRDQFVGVKKGPVAALDANDYILHSKSAGTLFYDADGSGPGEAIPFASVSGKISVSSISAVDW